MILRVKPHPRFLYNWITTEEKFCCVEMGDYFREDIDLGCNAEKVFLSGEYNYLSISFCPFCGAKIEIIKEEPI